MIVVIAKIDTNGCQSQVRDYSVAEIALAKKDGWMVKEYKDHYRPGLYTTKKQFLAGPGNNL